MSEEHDRIFIRNFSTVVAGLVAFTVVILLLAVFIHGTQDQEPPPAREAAKEERLQPVAGVYSGETGRAAAQAAAEAAAEEKEPELAFDGSTDGEMIYQRVCAACHASGAAGAPMLTAPDDWEERLDKGRDGLVESAIDGIGAMPPRGGRNDLGDEQVAASVDYMLDQID
ncbi:MAG: c-type cytochrome [Wenzhouxiangella sp.]